VLEGRREALARSPPEMPRHRLPGGLKGPHISPERPPLKNAPAAPGSLSRYGWPTANAQLEYPRRRVVTAGAGSARAGLRPLVWGEVFAGGIGGLLARVRPGHEPEPQTARNQINAWCDAHGIPAPLAGTTAPYAGTSTDGAPLLADDAEVAIVAGHLARLVTDVLLHPEESAFPAPAYAIGLCAGWIFSAPFEIWPIEFVGAGPWEAERDSTSVEQSLALLRELMPSAFDDHDQPAG
jgi:sulfur-carrier protein adenylyltransferase/sulfurtransferase